MAMTAQAARNVAHRYPVAYRDLWMIGPHLVGCGDLEIGHGAALLRLASRRIDLVYTDPPWTAALATQFRGRAGRPKRVDFPFFLNALGQVVRQADATALIEMGRQNDALLVDTMRRWQLTPFRAWDIVYYKTRPARLHLFIRGRCVVPPTDFTGADDADTPGIAVDAFTRHQDVVFDPCTGLGGTAAASADRGRQFVGLEISPVRLAAAIARLVDISGHDAVRIGALP